MTQNNNISVLPWYTSINEQNHRKSFAYGAIYPLFAPADRLLPFQILRNTRANNVTSVILYDKKGQQVANITTNMIETGLQVVRFQPLGYDVILYPAILPMPLNQLDGIYYMTYPTAFKRGIPKCLPSCRTFPAILKLNGGI